MNIQPGIWGRQRTSPGVYSVVACAVCLVLKYWVSLLPLASKLDPQQKARTVLQSKLDCSLPLSVTIISSHNHV